MVRAIVVLVMSVLVLAAGALAQATPSGREDRARLEQTDVRRMLHVRLTGDLDSVRMARDLARAIETGRGEGTELVLLEVSGRRWRGDVLREIGRVVTAEPRLPLMVVLDGDGVTIGLGQSWLALLADPGCAFATAGTKFEHASVDELIGLSPTETDHATIGQELRTMAAARMGEYGGPILLTALLPRPSGPLWCVTTGEGDGSLKMLTSEPTAAEVGRVLASADPRAGAGTPAYRAAFDAETARRLGLVAANVQGTGDVLARRALKVWKTDQIRIASTLGEARRETERAVRGIDEDRAGIKAALDANREKARSKIATTVEQAREAARRQLPALDAVERKIESAEAVCAEYPELLRTSPPGATTLTDGESGAEAQWRKAFRTRRDDVDRLRQRARTMAAAPDPK